MHPVDRTYVLRTVSTMLVQRYVQYVDQYVYTYVELYYVLLERGNKTLIFIATDATQLLTWNTQVATSSSPQSNRSVSSCWLYIHLSSHQHVLPDASSPASCHGRRRWCSEPTVEKEICVAPRHVCRSRRFDAAGFMGARHTAIGTDAVRTMGRPASHSRCRPGAGPARQLHDHGIVLEFAKSTMGPISVSGTRFCTGGGAGVGKLSYLHGLVLLHMYHVSSRLQSTYTSYRRSKAF